MAAVDVVRIYVQMLHPDELRGAALDDPSLRLVRCAPCPPARFLELYDRVGRAYHWRDRLAWSPEELARYLADPAVAVWELTRDGALAGFFELRRHDDGSVEIVLFGLLAEFQGRGLGRHLLTHAVRQAWQMGATRVWLHTCSLDSPVALPNYLARGFREFRRETYQTHLDGARD